LRTDHVRSRRSAPDWPSESRVARPHGNFVRVVSGLDHDVRDQKAACAAMDHDAGGLGHFNDSQSAPTVRCGDGQPAQGSDPLVQLIVCHAHRLVLVYSIVRLGGLALLIAFLRIGLSARRTPHVR
jgi:hypothetical protein